MKMTASKIPTAEDWMSLHPVDCHDKTAAATEEIIVFYVEASKLQRWDVVFRCQNWGASILGISR